MTAAGEPKVTVPGVIVAAVPGEPTPGSPLKSPVVKPKLSLEVKVTTPVEAS